MTGRLRPLLLGVVLLGVALPVGATMPEGWIAVQRALDAGDVAAFEEAVDELVSTGERVEVFRLTPYADALVAWAAVHDGELSAAALEAAERLDPELPAAAFLRARWAWADRDVLRAAWSYLQGWVHLVTFEDTRRLLGSSVELWLLITLGVALLIGAAVWVLRAIRRLAHDAFRIGSTMFRRANAIVFAAVLLALPLFAALGPLWLLMYLFAVSWSYLRPPQRIAAALTCLVLACVMPALQLWQATALKPTPLTVRVEATLDARRIDLSTLRSMVDLDEILADNVHFHLLLGEMFRMIDDAERSRIQFQRAALADPDSAVPYVFLGNLAMEDGDTAQAVQHFNDAIELDDRYALAFHNLSSAYDLSRRFEDGDAARARARQLAGGKSSELGIGVEGSRLRYPRLGGDDVDRMVEAMSPETRVEAGLRRTLPRPLDLILDPTSAVFWISALLGLALLAVRHRRLRPSRECVRCGKVYPPEPGTGDGHNHCSQCVSVFLRRDVVSIEQHTAKMQQIRRWDLRSGLIRRVVTVLIPGAGRVMAGDLWLGQLIAIIAWGALLGLVVWLPRFVGEIAPLAARLPVQVVLVVVLLAVWGWSVLDAWYRR